MNDTHKTQGGQKVEMEGVTGYSPVQVRLAGLSPDKRTPLGLTTALQWQSRISGA